ncbi:MAG: hypothetical protein N3F03_05515 [Ignavibacteria bacterium]|nr:hypothetical protein [Ignavibacteria bacterium]
MPRPKIRKEFFNRRVRRDKRREPQKNFNENCRGEACLDQKFVKNFLTAEINAENRRKILMKIVGARLASTKVS